MNLRIFCRKCSSIAEDGESGDDDDGELCNILHRCPHDSQIVLNPARCVRPDNRRDGVAQNVGDVLYLCSVSVDRMVNVKCSGDPVMGKVTVYHNPG